MTSIRGWDQQAVYWLASLGLLFLTAPSQPHRVLTPPSFPVMFLNLPGQPMGRAEPLWVQLSWTWMLDVCGSLHTRYNGGPDEAHLWPKGGSVNL